MRLSSGSVVALAVAATVAVGVPAVASASAPGVQRDSVSAVAPKAWPAFTGLDDHRAAGSAGVVQADAGGRFIQFSKDFSVDEGPAFYVYLVEGAHQETPDGPRLSELLSFTGRQRYEVPEGVTGTHTVLIWCDDVSVPIAEATLEF